MAKMTHPSMRRAGEKSVQTKAPKAYVVEDASSDKLDEQLKDFEQPKEVQQFESSVPPERKKKLESLVFLGKLSKDVKIMDHTFTLQTLTNKENNDIMKALYVFGDGADLFTIRVLTLANALKAVNGEPLGAIEIDGEFESDFHKRIAIIDDMQLLVIEKLYDAYNELLEECDKLVGGGEEIKK